MPETRALGDVPVGVEQDHRVAVALIGLELAAHEIAPVEVLHRRVDRAGRDALDAPRDDELQALRLLLGVRYPDVGDRVGVEAIADRARIALARQRHSTRRNHLDIGVAQPAAAHALEDDAPDLLARRWLQLQAQAAAFEAVEMIVEAEEPALPHRDDVVGAVRARKAHVEDRDPRLGNRHEFPVDPGTTTAEMLVHPCAAPARKCVDSGPSAARWRASRTRLDRLARRRVRSGFTVPDSVMPEVAPDGFPAE